MRLLRVTRPEFPALTGVRFPLALWVVTYHLSARGQMWQDLSRLPIIHVFIANAYVALGTFFALSGFLLMRGYSTVCWDTGNLRRYAVARFARLYPLYLLSLVVVAPIIRTAHAPAGSLWNYVFLLQGWRRPPFDWNTPAWSLSCEILFYALFPILVPLIRRVSWRSVACVGLLAFGLPLVVHALKLNGNWRPLLYVGDFLAGLAVAAAYDLMSVCGSSLYVPAMILGGGIILGGLHARSWMLFDEAMRCVNALVVLGLAMGGGRIHSILSSRWAVRGGEASYGIYILHIPVLWWYNRWFGGTQIPGPVMGAVYLLVVIGLSCAACRWIEAPANSWLRSLGQRRTRAACANGTPSAESNREYRAA